MREIKFRGKVKYNGGHRFSGEWVFGNLVKIKTFFPTRFHNQQLDSWVYAIQEYRPENGKYYRYEDVEVDENTIGQYTGLKDKNGVEIYEGDIVNYYNSYSHKQYVRVVKWEQMLACFSLYENYKDKWAQESDWIAITAIEVLGNIYDNHELLEVENEMV